MVDYIKTLVDKDVRKSWKVPAPTVAIGKREWKKNMPKFLNKVKFLLSFSIAIPIRRSVTNDFTSNVNLDDNTLKDVELEGITRPPVIHANANRMVPIGIDKNFDIKK